MIGKDKPIKISIITAVLNRADKIGNAIESVHKQFNDTMEHIIIDGGSTDGTLEVLKKYPHLKVISESDNGIYDAWNKGIHIASGEFITFLNSDDMWRDNSIQQIEKLLKINEGIVIANAFVMNAINSDQLLMQKKYISLSGEDLLASLTARPPAINAWFIPKKVFKIVGDFNPVFSIAADVDFCIRTIIAGIEIKPVDIQFYDYLAHSESLTLSQNRNEKYDYQYQNYLVAKKLLNETIKLPSIRKAIKRWLNIICYNLLVNGFVLKKDKKTLWAILKAGINNNFFFPLTFTLFSIKYWMKRILQLLDRKAKFENNG